MLPIFSAIRSACCLSAKRSVILLSLGLFTSFLPTAALAEDIKVAFIGDQGVSADAQRVLELIRDEGTELLLIQGDLGYDQGAANQWIENIDTILGEDFPVLMVVGNHENYEWPIYLQWQKDKLARDNAIRCEGDVSVKAYCTYKTIGVVQVSPGITEVEGIDGSDDYAGYITEKFATDDSTWRICSWHKNMRDMQAGRKGDATGWGVYQNCLAQGGLVMTGHEHSYSRTHLMSDFQNKQVIHTSDNMDIGPGSSLAFVSGLGGREVRAQNHGGDWFASIYTATQNASAGSLFCTFNESLADCYFKDVSGLVPDSFKLNSLLDSSGNTPEDPDSNEPADQDPAESDDQTPDESENTDPDTDGSDDQSPDESGNTDPDTDGSGDQTPDESGNTDPDTDGSDDQTPDESGNTDGGSGEPDGQTPDDSDTSNRSENVEPEQQDQPDADVAEQIENDESQAQSDPGVMGPFADEQQDGAEPAGLNTEEPGVAPDSDTDGSSDRASGPIDELSESGSTIAQSEANPFDTIPTSVTDDAAPSANEAIPAPPPPNETATTGGGTLGWLGLLSISIMVLLRRVNRRARITAT